MTKKIGILGFGKTGKSIFDFLRRYGNNIFYIWDDNFTKRSSKGILINRKYDDVKNIHVLYISPGFVKYKKEHPIIILAKKYNIPISSDINLFFSSYKDIRVIAITGTNGKSTTTSLIGHILKTKHVCGNIGFPVLSINNVNKDDIVVIELSSTQLSLVNKKYNINIAILLNISKDHIAIHGSMSRYIRAKYKIFEYQNDHNKAILCIDDKYTEVIYKELKSKNCKTQHIIPLSTTKNISYGVNINNNFLYDKLESTHIKYDIRDIKIHYQNIASAYAASRMFGINGDSIMKSMRTYKPLAHRIEIIHNVDGLTFVNDSKATNFHSSISALSEFKDIYWIVGGIYKNDDISIIEKYINNINNIFIFGIDARKIFSLINKYDIECHISNNIDNILVKIRNMNILYGTVLFSPGCSSFDQFTDFEERGNMFCKLVKKYWPL